MGFDLYGLNATSENGDYFRNNCWWWRPLWEFVCTHCNDILTEKQQIGGTFNDGTKIGPAMSIKIADRLQKKIDDGTADKAEKENKKIMKQAKMHNEKLDKKTKDPKHDIRDSYPFTVENLQDFIKFCRDSGGFTVN